MQILRITESKDAQYQYQVYAANGEHLVTGETYTQKHSAIEGFEALAIAVLKHLIKEDTLGFFLAKAFNEDKEADVEVDA